MNLSKLITATPRNLDSKAVAFDLHLPTFGPEASYGRVEGIAKEAERLGFEGLWISDHLINPAPHAHLLFPSARRDLAKDYAILEAWTLASALAVACKRARIGTYVLCNSFRHPSLVAKMASTLDEISGGRVDLGIGSGWLREEFEAYGIAWEGYSTRYERLREAVRVLKALFSGEEVSFEGKYYGLRGARLVPKPVQRPRIPIYVGGWSKKMIELAAEEADGWIPNNLPLKEMEGKVKFLGERAEKAGREIEVIYGIDNLIVSKDEGELSKLKRLKFGDLEMDEAKPWIVGKPDECLDKLLGYVKLGVRRFVIDFADPSPRTLRLFSNDVMNRL
ncbi:TPA: LLM class flavin-dependent oxidoreductase [Candidatus Bathyarchaeota archaeon]|nr:LLM class flavin-dependent oxidoreductase [Candidatus Bathyarchaeota archaeon]